LSSVRLSSPFLPISSVNDTHSRWPVSHYLTVSYIIFYFYSKHPKADPLPRLAPLNGNQTINNQPTSIFLLVLFLFQTLSTTTTTTTTIGLFIIVNRSYPAHIPAKRSCASNTHTHTIPRSRLPPPNKQPTAHQPPTRHVQEAIHSRGEEAGD
jgi:hypothetical protein